MFSKVDKKYDFNAYFLKYLSFLKVWLHLAHGLVSMSLTALS